MNAFDLDLILWINRLAHRSESFDLALGFVARSDMLTGYVFIVAFWWMWFSPRGGRERNREIVLATLAAACAAIVVGRGLALLLPFRSRPLFNPVLSFTVPYGVDQDSVALRTWSAFPSDHAMMFAAMATGLWFYSRRLGAAAHVYWLATIGFTRVYLGLHYPTDVLFGAALGTAMAAGADGARPRKAIARLPLAWHDRHESSFYAAVFIFTTQIATMFDGPRGLIFSVLKLLKGRL
jgi:undecaprenyl-diphosphatase